MMKFGQRPHRFLAVAAVGFERLKKNKTEEGK